MVFSSKITHLQHKILSYAQVYNANKISLIRIKEKSINLLLVSQQGHLPIDQCKML